MPRFILVVTSRLRPIIWAKSQAALPRPAEVLAVELEDLDEVGVGEQGLGGDAAPVQADAAQLVAFDAEGASCRAGRREWRRRIRRGRRR